jgi:hypothetical protein
MVHAIVHHHVKDYAAWRPVFDADRPFLEQAGCRGFHIYRSPEDPNDLYVQCRFDDLDRAKSFFGDDRLKQAMAKGGVEGVPEIFYIEELDSGEMGGPAVRAA